MKSLLTISAIFEAATGLGVIIMPKTVMPLLLGVSFVEPEFAIISAVLGSAMIVLAMICWLYRNMGLQAVGIVKGMLVYNVAAGLALVYGGLMMHLNGLGLWPAAGVHSVLIIWCIVILGKK